MRESDLVLSRRSFLISSLKATGVVAAGIIVGPAMWEALDQMGPRRLLVPGYKPVIRWTGSGVYWDVTPITGSEVLRQRAEFNQQYDSVMESYRARMRDTMTPLIAQLRQNTITI